MKEEVMQVAQYLFQSPYTSAVQVGRLDPNASQSQDTSQTSTQDFVSSKAQPKAKEVTQTQGVKPSANTNSVSPRLLDVTA